MHRNEQSLEKGTDNTPLETLMVYPTTGAKIQRTVVYSDQLPATFNVDYEHSATQLITRWLILIAFSIVFGTLAVIAQAKWSPTNQRHR